MSKAMGTGMQVVNHCIPSFVFMLKRRGDWMAWNCCLQLSFACHLYGRMEWWYEKGEGIHSNGLFFYVGKRYFVQSVPPGEH